MKNLPLLIMTAVTVYCQANAQEVKPPETKKTDVELGKYYLAKSKSQKTAAFIMLGAGVAGWIGGGIGASNDLYNESSGNEILILVGFGLTVASIPMFITSAKNKGRAEILLRHEIVPLGHIPNIPTKYPAIGFKIPIGK